MKLLRSIKTLFVKKSIELRNIEKKIKYRFGRTYYLEKALTHRSIQNHSRGNYERLEFLGDAVIDQVVSHCLFTIYPQADEGTLTKLRASIVNRDSLAKLGQNLNIIDCLRIEKNVDLNDPKVVTKIASNIYEAIVGAIFLDGGPKESENFIKRTMCISEFVKSIDNNYKGQLIEHCHSKNLPSPQFNIVDAQGPDHNKTFMIEVIIPPLQTWTATGSTIKSAEQSACKQAINYLLEG